VTRGRARKEARPVRYVGVDEKAFRKGHRYHTIVCDLERSTVEYVAEGHDADALAPFFAGLTVPQREALAGVAMDMWDPYILATRTALPGGADKIVFDRFHAMRQVTTAVDDVRKAEHRELLERDGVSVLKKTRHLWLYNEAHVPVDRREEFQALRRAHLKVGRAWAIKEALRELWTYRQPAAARRFFRRWYHWARCSGLPPIRQAAATLHRYADGLLRYCQHPITNGVAEGLNSKIMSIKRKACGFRNPAHFTTAIFFHCGGLDLYPR
jgi:transposase